MRILRRVPSANAQLIGLLALALAPLIVFGLIATGHLGGAVAQSVDREADKTLNAVHAVLEEREQELSSTVSSYATWDQLTTHLASKDASWLKSAVLDFVVTTGDADAAVLLADPALSAGSEGVVAATTAWATKDWTGGQVVDLFPLDGAVYSVAIAPVRGAAPTAAGRPATLVLARRLDEQFVTQASSMTGWEVAVAGTGGGISVATRQDMFQKLDPPRDGATGTHLQQTGEIAGGSRAILDAEGRSVGRILVATEIGALGSISSQVLGLLALALAPAVVAALGLSVLLSLRIRRRVTAIETGIAAVASGDYSVRLPEGGGGEFDRLASSHNTLAMELEHRDRTLSLLLESLATLRPSSGVGDVARDGVSALAEIFGLGHCELRDANGETIAAAGVPHVSDARDGSDDDNVVRISHGAGRLELHWGDAPAGWSPTDAALIELYAGQFGAALQDAKVHERTEERAQELDRVNKLQADFLRGVSHNLQSPLTAIVGLSDELRERGDVTADARERADAIHADAQRLRMLVRQLLTMSRLEAGAVHLEAELFNVEPVLRRAWEAHGSARPFELTNRASRAFAVGDAQALEQVAWILFDNALRYAPDGPVSVEIACSGERIEIRVEDEGPGVPASERAAIFRRFKRGSTSAGQDGTGLGLDVARGLLRAMGGRVRYEPGRVGAAFVIDLPAEAATPD